MNVVNYGFSSRYYDTSAGADHNGFAYVSAASPNTQAPGSSTLYKSLSWTRESNRVRLYIDCRNNYWTGPNDWGIGNLADVVPRCTALLGVFFGCQLRPPKSMQIRMRMGWTKSSMSLSSVTWNSQPEITWGAYNEYSVPKYNGGDGEENWVTYFPYDKSIGDYTTYYAGGQYNYYDRVSDANKKLASSITADVAKSTMIVIELAQGYTDTIAVDLGLARLEIYCNTDSSGMTWKNIVDSDTSYTWYDRNNDAITFKWHVGPGGVISCIGSPQTLNAIIYWRKTTDNTWNEIQATGGSGTMQKTVLSGTFPRADIEWYVFSNLSTGGTAVSDHYIFTTKPNLQINTDKAKVICGDNITISVVNREDDVIQLSIFRSDEDTTCYTDSFSADTVTVSCNDTWFTDLQDTSIDQVQMRAVAVNADDTEAVAVFTLAKLPVIVDGPADCRIGEGSAAVFTVDAIYNPLYYQWQKSSDDGNTWSNVTANTESSTLEFTSALSQNGNLYRCAVTNNAGTIYSDAAELTVLEDVRIVTQPADVAVAAGNDAVLSLIASGDELSYQWQTRSGDNEEWADYTGDGANTPSLAIDQAAVEIDGFQYRCVITNPFSEVTSDTITLVVVTPPIITQHPHSILIDHGLSSAFTADASGHNIYYQWQRRENSAGTWANIGDNALDGKQYSFRAHVDYDGYQYRCIISNIAGTAYTNAATLQVVVNDTHITEWICQDENGSCTFQSDGHSPLRIVIYTQDGEELNGCRVKPMLEEGTRSRVWISPVQGDHDISNDFNYGWLSIGNLYDDRENVLMSSLPCEIKLRYRPIWKDTL